MDLEGSFLIKATTAAGRSKLVFSTGPCLSVAKSLTCKPAPPLKAIRFFVGAAALDEFFFVYF